MCVQASFLLSPRTPLEWVAFCRQHLGLEFPEDPVTSDAARKDAQDGTKGGKMEDYDCPIGYSVVSDFGRPPPRVPLVLLCIDRGILEGKPSPILGLWETCQVSEGSVALYDVEGG